MSIALEAFTLSDGAGKEEKASAGDPAEKQGIHPLLKFAAGWNRTLAEIRLLEGFENFLRVTPFAQLREAASDGPVILVNIGQHGSDAIIIHKTAGPAPIPLPDATPLAIEVLVPFSD
ncbi:hypothetical protein FRB97_007724 [Tulasnella sp. 331]|nr:hypothetical protein FRB97_007724 [Tulasnella sp. 331]KAG8889499.1 hypothetical protein FRB98_003973 [Tulasnella sp. 332]